MVNRIGAADALCKGVHAVEWDLAPGVPLVPGTRWRYRGRALRLDGEGLALWLGRPLVQQATRRPRARARAARLLPRGPGLTRLAPEIEPDPHPLPDFTDGGDLVLTDGRHLFPARLVEAGDRRTLVFDPWLPPPGTDLWVAACTEPAPAPRRALCDGIPAGSLIATDRGPRRVETLRPGDLVLTRDHGARPILWHGMTRLSGAELILHPELRPLWLAPGAPCQRRTGPGRSPVRVAPGQRVLVPGLPCLHGRTDALATAADLEGCPGVRRDLGAGSVAYVHLMLARHEILRLTPEGPDEDGIFLASFHPAMADPAALRWHARSLDRALPGIVAAPQRLGDPARRCLSQAEAALLAYAA